MSEKTARHYRDDRKLPSTRQTPRSYRTRVNPFVDVWPSVEERLRAEPRLQAKTLFDWLRRDHPGLYLDSHRRTLLSGSFANGGLLPVPTGRWCFAKSTRRATSPRRISRA